MTSSRLIILSCTVAVVAAGGALHGIKDASARTDSLADLQSDVQNIVVIYAENRSFDNLYGNFPGANGVSAIVGADGKPRTTYVPQKDRDGLTVLPILPPTWGGVTKPGASPAVTEAESANLPNAPFSVEAAFAQKVNGNTVTHDLVHRFYENQMQIDGGKNDMFAAWTDAGGLTMAHFDYSNSALYKLARQFVLADNFYQGAFGGSFLNHQYLICACAPEYPNADKAAAKPSLTTLKTDASGKYLPELAPSARMPKSALDGPPSFERSGNITPPNYFGDGKFYVVNTMQPAYQPSGNAPLPGGGNNSLYADTTKATTLPPQTAKTIGDMLTAKNVTWKWYGGAWSAAVADGVQDPAARRAVIYAAGPNGVANATSVDFQPHHQPFNYYSAFDPVRHATERAAHLKDFNDLVADAAAGTLPSVAFYKPEGEFNQHEGNTNLADGDAKIADLIAKLQAGPQWKNMLIVITYDEFGGTWDHASPPKADLLGPGTRIPAIVVSPFAKKGTVDHTQYDTGSILRLITRRFGLDVLPGLAARDKALRDAGSKPMGDLTAALQLR